MGFLCNYLKTTHIFFVTFFGNVKGFYEILFLHFFFSAHVEK